MDAKQVASLLNEMLALDPEATRNLVFNRVPCNDALADHPTIQVRAREDGSCEVGLLGVLNALIEPEYRIAVTIEDDQSKVHGFEVREAASFGRGAGDDDDSNSR